MAGLTISIVELRCRRSNARESTARIVRSVGVTLGRSIYRCSTKDLVPKREDLGITFVTGHQQQPETSDQEPEQVRKDR